MTRSRLSLRPLWATLLVGLACACPKASAADCPASWATCNFCPYATWMTAFKDTLLDSGGFVSMLHARADWVSDTLAAQFWTGFGNYDGSFEASEGFQIIGLPAGTLTSCSVSMELVGGAHATWSDDPTQAFGSATIWISPASASAAAGSAGTYTSQSSSCFGYICQSSGTLTTTLTTSAQVTAGVPFTVSAHFTGSGGGNVLNPAYTEMGAKLSFTLSDPGSGIVSCHGHTPVRVLAVGPEPGTGLRISASWPNPALGAFGVTFETSGPGPATLRLLDIQGREIERTDWEAPGSGVQVAVMNRDARHAPGTYLLQLTQGGVSDVKVVTLLR